MGTPLTGLEIRDTYDALIKITDNGPIGATAKLLSDGLGNDSVLTLSTTSVGVGGDTSGTVSGVTINAKFCVKSEGTVSGAGFVYANDTTAANGSVIYACRSRGTIASPTAVVSGDRLASLIFAGNDGTDLALAAQINIEADGTVGANDMPGRITFLTTPDGTQAPTEKMRIANDGKLKFNSYGSGTITGTAAYNLGVDASGNVIELPGGVIDGAGTANYVPKWTDANTLGDSQIFDNGTNVGIGTSTPSTKLHVSDSGAVGINVTSSASQSFMNFTSVNTAGFEPFIGFGGTSAGDQAQMIGVVNGGVRWTVAGSERMRITAAGNVGIGTSSPASTLDVVGTLAVSGAGVFGSDLRTNATLQVGNPNVVGNKVIQITPSTTTTPANIQGVWAGTGAYDITLQTSGGKVGIGTTTPALLLDIVGTNAVGVKVTETGGSEARLVAGGSTTFFGTYSDHPLAILTNSVEKVRITSTGNVGIGTSSPAVPLDVNGTIRSTGNEGKVAINSTAVSGKQYELISIDTGNLGLYDGTDYRLWVSGAGNVGIGTTSPNKKLHVVGPASVTSTTSTLGSSDTGIYASHGSIAANYNGIFFQGISLKDMYFGRKGEAGIDDLIVSTAEASPVELVRFRRDGGITFNGDTAAANALDDYEEGTFTPVFRGATSAGSYTFAVGGGSYTKIGNQVTVWISLIDITESSAGSGEWQIGGLPFTSRNAFDLARVSTACWIRSSAAARDNILCGVFNNSSNISFLYDANGSGAGNNFTIASDFLTNMDIGLQVTYYV